MPGLKELRKRIGSVKNTQQTTKAMKLVSAAKLRRAQEGIFSNRPYAKKIDHLIRTLSAMRNAESTSVNPTEVSPLVAAPPPGAEKILLISVSSDRGLCGGFNANIIKKTIVFFKENQGKKIELACLGKKAAEVLTIRGYKASQFWEFGRKATFEQARLVSDFAVEKYLSGEYASVKFVYNEFKNAITQQVVVEDFLPLQKETKEHLTSGQVETIPNYLVKPSIQETLDALLKKHFAIQVYRIVLESQASEHGARMSSMDSATRNASEMIRKLTLVYNKQRQAGITKELLEIIAGSEAQKN